MVVTLRKKTKHFRELLQRNAKYLSFLKHWNAKTPNKRRGDQILFPMCTEKTGLT